MNDKPDKPSKPKRDRRILVRVLLTLATLLAIVSVLAIWANRQLLNTDNWSETSTQLLERQAIRQQLADYLVTQLYANVDVAAELRRALPPQAQALAAPLAAGLQQAANRAALQLLSQPKVQAAWRKANQVAHKQLLQVLEGGSNTVSTKQGNVVLNLRPLVDQLAAQLGLEQQLNAARTKLQSQSGQQAKAAAQAKLGVQIPQDTAQLEILKSDQLKTAQDITQFIKGLALWLTIVVLLLYALAIYLARGWRREALRAVGFCFIGVGLGVLIVRKVAGNGVTDALVSADSVKPAADEAWDVATRLLKELGGAILAYGIALFLAAWLAGPTKWATGLRRALAPSLRDHPGIVYGVVGFIYLLLLLWGPTQALRTFIPIVIIAGLIVLAIELLRRQTAREFPDAQPGEASSAGGSG